MDIGTRVRVSENPWVDQPGGFVDPEVAGKIGTVDSSIQEWGPSDDRFVSVVFNPNPYGHSFPYSQFISLECLEEVTDE